MCHIHFMMCGFLGRLIQLEDTRKKVKWGIKLIALEFTIQLIYLGPKLNMHVL